MEGRRWKGWRENRKEESCVDKVEKVEQWGGGRRKILGGRKNNGDTRGKGIGFFGIDEEEGASRSSLDTVLRWVNCRDTSYFMVSFLGIWFPSKNSEILPVTIVPEIQ